MFLNVSGLSMKICDARVNRNAYVSDTHILRSSQSHFLCGLAT